MTTRRKYEWMERLAALAAEAERTHAAFVALAGEADLDGPWRRAKRAWRVAEAAYWRLARRLGIVATPREMR